jgi:hypothetical protein
MRFPSVWRWNAWNQTHKKEQLSSFYTSWQILSISFVLTQFSTFLPPECLGLFPKHLIHSLIILLHWNLWIGCYASIEQALGPPFDKMSHTVTAWQVCQIQNLTTEIISINEAHRSEFEFLWQMSHQVTLLPQCWLKHIHNLTNHLRNLYLSFQDICKRAPILSSGPSARFPLPE